MSLTSKLAPMVLMGALFFGTALADELGPAGVVLSMELRTTSADAYLISHGSLIVLETAGNAETEYRWGGTSCGSRVLTEFQVARLFDLAATPYMAIAPRYKNGQGPTTLCLVGFKAFNTKYE